MKGYYGDLSLLPEIGGQFSVFTIPGILVFLNGKEVVREARFISMEQLETQLNRLIELVFS
jgi:hypothetical protein